MTQQTHAYSYRNYLFVSFDFNLNVDHRSGRKKEKSENSEKYVEGQGGFRNSGDKRGEVLSPEQKLPRSLKISTREQARRITETSENKKKKQTNDLHFSQRHVFSKPK